MINVQRTRLTMAIRKILYLPDERLRKIAKPVETFDESLQTLINDMFDTMYDARGVGLAAPQIGVSLRLSVIDVVGDKKEQIVIVNPEIVSSHGEKEFEEGCLSVPGAYDTVVRAEKVTVKALDRFGKPFEITGEGLLAECLQHEIDHMNGKLFVDMLSPLKRMMARRKLDKFKRLQARKL
ncbi:TPA: peptide deformylase [Legionella pneumophila]|uniref:Peptide deformylase n=2 Tax=Legionella pneumophila TaxID=446 RepID=A0AAX2IZX0_LEGPN|nr:peptide deformylase [Legionella pneumophila subsp. pascullei]HAT6917354.1 peptide deformylase [Legionella pneumophila]SQG91483.1 peptide deformylase [Legionella pneumophila subsp. pascullei]VEH08029.1 peptide deformylase [Legionella pneumophila subsp. pascullei]HAT6919795.1 peptide deformylase [Legionella pneumophila]